MTSGTNALKAQLVESPKPEATIGTQRANARKLAERFCIFPIVNGAKTPAVRFTQEATQDQAKLDEWYAGRYATANIGVLTDGLIVLDLDLKSNGVENMKALAATHSLPPTYTVDTASGGMHAYYRLPEGADPSRYTGRVHLFEDELRAAGVTLPFDQGVFKTGIDTRSFHNYVVAPGSVLVKEGGSKTRYTLRHDADVAVAPDWLLAACERSAGSGSIRRDDAELNHANGDKDQTVARARCIEYLTANADSIVSVKGSGGDTTAYKVACKLRDLGATYDTAGDLMRSAHWGYGYGWSSKLENKPIRNAFIYGQNAAGADSVEGMFRNLTLAPELQDDPVIQQIQAAGWTIRQEGNVYSIERHFEDDDPELARITKIAVENGWRFTRTADVEQPANDQQSGDELDALDHELQAPSREHTTGGEDEELYGPQDITAEDLAGTDYLVKGWVGRGILAQAFGTWNAGKTAATDSLAVHVAAGAPWFGNRVREGGVLVCSYEGKGRRKRRIAALKDAYPDLPWATMPIRWVNLRKPLVVEGGNGACAGRRVLLRNLRRFKDQFGAYPALVVVDPLANALGGPEEPGFTRPYLALARGIIRVTGATVLHVHHTGHTNKDRGRGDSALPADADADLKIEMTDEKGMVGTISGEKQRDDAKAVLHYRLWVVKLGADSDGDPITSIACVPANQAGEDDFPVPNQTAAEKLASDRERVMSYLTMQPAGFEFSVWGLGRQCKEIGLSQDRAEAAAEGLRAIGAFEEAGKVGKGARYRLPSGPAKGVRSSLAFAQASLSELSDGFERVTPSRSNAFPKSDERKRIEEPSSHPDLAENPWVALVS